MIQSSEPTSPEGFGGHLGWRTVKRPLRIADKLEQIPVRIPDIDALTDRVPTVTAAGPLTLRDDLRIGGGGVGTDQFGADLGKPLAQAAEAGGQDFDPSTDDLIRRAFA